MDILIEDSDILVLNKPAGFIVEGPSKDGRLSLTDRIRKELGLNVFCCHRLDRDTTGVVVFAKNKKVLCSVNQLFASKRVKKTYLARVEGDWNPAWNRVVTFIAKQADGSMANSESGKEAITTFRRLANWNHKSLIEALPKTGRTHQIRLHTLFHNCPISGDIRYGKQAHDSQPMALHARKLQFRHPESKQLLELTAPLPDYWGSYWLKDCPIQL